jgi:putative hydrolase of the HAD superfamily
MIRAVFWDFGGVISTSPFEAFNRLERERGLPLDFIRTINATNPDHNAWARLERNEISLSEFDRIFAGETQAAGFELPGLAVIEILSGDLRPEMVEAIRHCRGRFINACLTNNIRVGGDGNIPVSAARIAAFKEVMALFDAVIESSRTGLRKPNPLFYERACELVKVAPAEVVFLDDLGINLKPAKAMGMTTIKVIDSAQAIRDLEAVLGIPLR